MSAFFLYLTILNLFNSPNLKGKFNGSEHFVALLTAVLWAINPIQTQAVTYIVQRMAILATMFYILGIYFFIRVRLSDSISNRIFFIAGCIMSFILALGSKENAAMLPVALTLVEIVFFQDMSSQKTKRLFIGIAAGTGVLVLIIGLLFFMKGDPFYFLKGYDYRPFSFVQRLMTEPMIVIYYLSQIFYPVPNRLSIEHDVILLTSILKPWTTIPAILIIILLIGIGISLIKKRPIIAFAILFFFLNHIIESSIIPLELVFEHRNYLPSLFLFIPVSVWVKWLIDYYREKQFSMYIIIVSFVTILLIGLGTGTYIRNMAWATEKSLWEDAMHKAPGSARPLTNLAWEMSYGKNAKAENYDLALKLYKKSLSLQKSRELSNPIILNNMAGIYLKKGESQKAVGLMEKALDINPDYNRGRYDFIQILITSGKWDEASKNADRLISKAKNHEGYLNIKGFILLKQKRPEEAIEYFQKSLKIAPNFKTTLMYMGSALSLSGYYSRADWFLNRAAQKSSGDIMIYFCLIENSLRAGDESRAEKYTEKLFTLFNLKTIETNLKMLSRDYRFAPVSQELIYPIIKRKLIEISDNFKLLE
ncbi:MAG: tetratricopeptide repeat protein [Desulfobacterales bacterium]